LVVKPGTSINTTAPNASTPSPSATPRVLEYKVVDPERMRGGSQSR